MEFLYPLMQAYDSVALNADVELGGTDQRFNLLIGRTVQERYGQSPQICLIMPLLRGTDGELKMSKSYGNYIGISESAEEQYGKTMSIPDSLLAEWYDLVSLLPPDELAAARARVATEPYQAKRALARIVAHTYHGEEGARRAEAHFDRVFREKARPDGIPEMSVALPDPQLRYKPESGVWLPALLVKTGLAASNAEAARLIEQGAIAVDDVRVSDRNAYLSAQGAPVLRRGKRQFVQVRFTGE
jgi:tyrosyl-tRNA synthetase